MGMQGVLPIVQDRCWNRWFQMERGGVLESEKRGGMDLGGVGKRDGGLTHRS